MDDTDTNQEASSQSSTEDTPRPIDLRAIGSPTFAPLSPIQIERSPPEEGKEETKRESPEPETEFTSTTIHVNEYNSKFILEYNYPNTSIDLALATVVHYGLRSQ